MAIGDPYVTLTEFKEYANIKPGTIGLDLTAEMAIEAASSEVERICNRQFNKATSATARVYRPDRSGVVHVDDFYTTDGLLVEVATGPTTWQVVPLADYEVGPANGIVDGQPGWPFYRLTGRALLRYSLRLASVRVTAKWGWSEVPGPVKQACLIIASEAFNMKDAPFGVAGMDMWGPVRIRDNRVAASKLARYARHKLLVG
ncbi:hypothetical protein C6N75_09975 [Streptomyces solincola]|uniref:Uncharacterized protein n=1 Tax=Streptomyces solincola TaxID=2100817 RepID=A0A2S9PYA2_9ACTN|nr:hypothetical protein [Streptomyces solincola]PRH79401.1 hypothetical protein C6N75_09975 [Streptomyces solincola]